MKLGCERRLDFAPINGEELMFPHTHVCIGLWRKKTAVNFTESGLTTFGYKFSPMRLCTLQLSLAWRENNLHIYTDSHKLSGKIKRSIRNVKFQNGFILLNTCIILFRMQE